MRNLLLLSIFIVFPYFIYSQQCVRDTSLHEFQYFSPNNFGWTLPMTETHLGYMRGQSLYHKTYAVECQQSNKMIIVSSKAENETFISRSEENGRVDTTFANGGGLIINTLFPTFARFFGLKLYQDNIYIALSNDDLGNITNYIVGLDANGNPLSSFGNNGVVHLNTNLHSVAYTAMNIDANGNIILAGRHRPSAQIDITKIAAATGSEITSFGNNGVGSITASDQPDIKSILVDNGAILVSGARENGVGIVAKFSANGTPDLSFNGTGYIAFSHPTYKFGKHSNLHKTTDGNYILTGSLWDNNTWENMVYALEFNTQGIINTSYGNNGWSITDIGENSANGDVKSQLLEDDRLLISSMKVLHKTASIIDSSKIAILMLKADGTVDNTFAPGGLFYDQLLFRNYSDPMGEHRVLGMIIDKKGKLIIVGHGKDCTNGFCGDDGFLARYIFQETTTASLDDEHTNKVNVTLYPNPTTREVTIDLGMVLTNVSVVLINNLGQELSAQQYESTDYIKLDIDAPAGIYFLSIKSNKGYVKTLKLIKN